MVPSPAVWLVTLAVGDCWTHHWLLRAPMCSEWPLHTCSMHSRAFILFENLIFRETILLPPKLLLWLQNVIACFSSVSCVDPPRPLPHHPLLLLFLSLPFLLLLFLFLLLLPILLLLFFFLNPGFAPSSPRVTSSKVSLSSHCDPHQGRDCVCLILVPQHSLIVSAYYAVTDKSESLNKTRIHLYRTFRVTLI